MSLDQAYLGSFGLGCGPPWPLDGDGSLVRRGKSEFELHACEWRPNVSVVDTYYFLGMKRMLPIP